MNVTKISLKQMAKLLGVSVSEAVTIHNSLIAKGYIKPLKNGAACILTAPDHNMAAKIPYNPIRFTS